MEKFLEVVYINQLQNESEEFLNTFAPLLQKLQGILNEKIYEEILEIFIDCATENNRFYAVEGMKLAIGIINGTYTIKA